MTLNDHLRSNHREMSFFSRWFSADHPVDAELWHRWLTIIPVKAIDGHWTVGDVWRRRHDGRWQFQRHEETTDEWYDRQI